MRGGDSRTIAIHAHLDRLQLPSGIRGGSEVFFWTSALYEISFAAKMMGILHEVESVANLVDRRSRCPRGVVVGMVRLR